MKTITIATRRNEPDSRIYRGHRNTPSRSARRRWTLLIFVSHTTCALDHSRPGPGTDLDFIDALRRLLPEISYRHPHDPSHTPDHILSSIIGPSIAVPYRNRQLMLGTWQRIVLVELSGPRSRTLHISFSG